MSEMLDISGPHKLTSKLKVSSTQKQPNVEGAMETQKIKEFEVKMEEINRAFIMAREIRSSLEAAWRDLS